MEVKYQVFISSTYDDLKEERAVVTETILKLEQIPIGMEMFNAGDEAQWELIKRTIDNSDYYVVILGNRYGSTTEDGISYTEKEYNYASSIGKPILTFITSERKESSEGSEATYRLDRFKAKAKTKICNFWKDKHDLGRLVSTSLHATMTRTPGTGWIRANEYLTQKKELVDLIRRYDELNRLRQAEADNEDTDEARWASEGEITASTSIKKVLLNETCYNAAGLPIVVHEESNELFVDDSEAHSLIVGSTGSGKTRRVILPLINVLARKGESMVVTDPKGELYMNTKCSLEENGYRILTINLREPQKGNAWNPLELPYKNYKDGNIDRAVEMLYELANNIFKTDRNPSNDPFWTDSAADYFSGLALALFEDANPDEINLNSILAMDASGNERFGGAYYINEYYNNHKNPNDLCYINVSGTINAPSDTKGSILSVFRQALKVYVSKNELSKMLATSDFDLSEIENDKHAIFIIMPDEKRTYHPLVSTFIKQCYDVLLLCAHSKTGKLNSRINFVLDEFANITPISDMSSMITASRSRNIRFYLVIQGMNQLSSAYGVADSEVIKGNCANLVYLVSKELATLREISELCGNEKIAKTGQIGLQKPLISVNRLLKMPLGQVLINKERESPFLSHLPDISAYSCWSKPLSYFDEKEIIHRQYLKVFDFKEYVKELKKEKLKQMMSSEKE